MSPSEEQASCPNTPSPVPIANSNLGGVLTCVLRACPIDYDSSLEDWWDEEKVISFLGLTNNKWVILEDLESDNSTNLNSHSSQSSAITFLHWELELHELDVDWNGQNI